MSIDGGGDFAAFEQQHIQGGADAPSTGSAVASDDVGVEPTAVEDEIDANVSAIEGEPSPIDSAPIEKSLQEQIEELSASKRAAEVAAADALRSVDYWRKQVEATPAPVEQNAEQEDGAPDPAKYEYGEADSRYIAELSRYSARKEFETLASQAEINRQISTIEDEWRGRAATVSDQFPDFQEKVISSADRGEWPCTQMMAMAIKTSDVGPAVAYHLATNREEAVRIANMEPIQQARAFGRLEAQYLNPPTPVRSPIKATSAPIPPAFHARGAGGKFAVSPSTKDFAAFEAMASKA